MSIKFNDEHIPDSPFIVPVASVSDDGHLLTITSLQVSDSRSNPLTHESFFSVAADGSSFINTLSVRALDGEHRTAYHKTRQVYLQFPSRRVKKELLKKDKWAWRSSRAFLCWPLWIVSSSFKMRWYSEMVCVAVCRRWVWRWIKKPRLPCSWTEREGRLMLRFTHHLEQWRSVTSLS